MGREGEGEKEENLSGETLAGAKSLFSKEGGGDFEGYGNIRVLENVRKISSRLLASVSNLNLEQGSSNCT